VTRQILCPDHRDRTRGPVSSTTITSASSHQTGASQARRWAPAATARSAAVIEKLVVEALLDNSCSRSGHGHLMTLKAAATPSGLRDRRLSIWPPVADAASGCHGSMRRSSRTSTYDPTLKQRVALEGNPRPALEALDYAKKSSASRSRSIRRHRSVTRLMREQLVSGMSRPEGLSQRHRRCDRRVRHTIRIIARMTISGPPWLKRQPRHGS